jgi:hypothetical protein
MVQHLFADFLNDPKQYARAQAYWTLIWKSIDPLNRDEFGWRTPWFENPLLDGNPIFTAVSLKERKGLRIIQFAPTAERLEFHMWLDTFGGPTGDPESIAELVISCALSNEAAQQARSCMQRWIVGEAIIEPAGRLDP